MDRTTLQRYLAQADDHVDGGRLRVELQRRLVEQIRAQGNDATDAEALLRRFELMVQMMEADRNFIEGMLRKSE